MTLNQLRYFCTASRCHSITKAAEELYVTQPTISMAIRDLEIEFGISLFSRKGNQLSLTQEGESFYKKATYILQYCNELQADYSSMSRIKPPLRIGIRCLRTPGRTRSPRSRIFSGTAYGVSRKAPGNCRSTGRIRICPCLQSGTG